MFLHFLGSGNATSQELGTSCAVLEIGTHDTLVIDFGPDSLHRFQRCYAGKLPQAIFITHCHLDHIAGLESLFYAAFDAKTLIQLFIPVTIVANLHQRLATLDSPLAEGGVNFWDHFQLIPVDEKFWYAGMKFRVFEARHHAPGFCYGLSLPGKFLFTGDTKPIPEVINHLASQGEIIFHDLSLRKQPSHSFLEEVLTSYSERCLKRMRFYHLHSQACHEVLESRNLLAVAPGDRFDLDAGSPNDIAQILSLSLARH